MFLMLCLSRSNFKYFMLSSFRLRLPVMLVLLSTENVIHTGIDANAVHYIAGFPVH